MERYSSIENYAKRHFSSSFLFLPSASLNFEFSLFFYYLLKMITIDINSSQILLYTIRRNEEGCDILSWEFHFVE